LQHSLLPAHQFLKVQDLFSDRKPSALGEGTLGSRDSDTKFTPQTNLSAGVKMLKNLGGTARGKTKCFYALQIGKA
jgi:hypothetical protein